MAGVTDPCLFWSMTPHEINLVIRGFKRRLLAAQAVSAYGGAVAASGWTGHQPNPPFKWNDDGLDELPGPGHSDPR